MNENPLLMAETLLGEMEDQEVMSEEELQGVVSAEIYDAISYIDDDIGDHRARATQYYYGEALAMKRMAVHKWYQWMYEIPSKEYCQA